jgi:hypothetical protein
VQDPPNSTPTSTEDIPPTPGWVEQDLDEILADPQIGLPQRPGLLRHRNEYLDCLAGAPRSADIDEWHDQCRGRFLTALGTQEGIKPEQLRRLEERLEALEGEISARV